MDGMSPSNLSRAEQVATHSDHLFVPREML